MIEEKDVKSARRKWRMEEGRERGRQVKKRKSKREREERRTEKKRKQEEDNKDGTIKIRETRRGEIIKQKTTQEDKGIKIIEDGK